MATQAPELNRLMDNARVHLPGALDAGLKLELFNTLDEFLQGSKFWQEDIEYTARAGRTSYEVIGTEAGAVIELMANVNSSGRDVSASMPALGTLVLRADPMQTDTFTATVAYTVVDPMGTEDYPVIPEGALIKYGDGIKAGLIARMMLQPAKPYTNQQLAVLNMRKFNGTIAQARADVRHRNVYDGQTWRFPSFARGRQR
jgi:hypothetical protein